MRLPTYQIILADVLAGIEQIPDNSIDLVVSSPPYWGQRDYGMPGQLGREPTSQEYVENMARVFIQLRPKLKAHGWIALNLGDSYSGSGGQGYEREISKGGVIPKMDPRYKPRDLVNVPHRVYEALRESGYWWRSTVIWVKSNGSPEAVYGVRWVRHRVRVGDQRQDCPGCEKCAPHGGLVLSWGSGRPMQAYETVAMLTNSRYYWDNEAVRTPYTQTTNSRRKYGVGSFAGTDVKMTKEVVAPPLNYEFTGSNARNVQEIPDEEVLLKWLAREHPTVYTEYQLWRTESNDVLRLPTAQFSGAHFATYHPDLPSFFIRAGTSEYGCCAECGAPWARVLEQAGRVMEGVHSRTADVNGYSETSALRGNGIIVYRTVGWKPTCGHTAERVPAVVCDPFSGAGTTGLVANRLGRDYVGIDINPEFVKMSEQRIMQDAPLFYLPGFSPQPESTAASSGRTFDNSKGGQDEQ